MRLLERIGAANPPLRLTGTDLHTVGALVDRLLHDGWSAQQIEHTLAWPLPREVYTSVAAVLAARLRALGTSPGRDSALSGAWCPDAARDTAGAPSGLQRRADGPDLPQPGATAPPVVFGVLVECGDCGRPGTVTGTGLCPACLDWPACRSCAGPTPRRADPAGDGRCSACTEHNPRPTPEPGLGL
ncbi:hypothetical protein ACFWU3_33320 [Streptomyces sp. NPDC058685]|uniref:hypothetical protein n=1 Tax=Streptomyces sp. NPDC058685 TaxID=3346598 RepID=UPI00364F64ED